MEAFQQLVDPPKAVPIPYSTCVPKVGQAPGTHSAPWCTSEKSSTSCSQPWSKSVCKLIVDLESRVESGSARLLVALASSKHFSFMFIESSKTGAKLGKRRCRISDHQIFRRQIDFDEGCIFGLKFGTLRRKRGTSQ